MESSLKRKSRSEDVTSIDETSIKDVTSILKSLADGKDRYEIKC